MQDSISAKLVGTLALKLTKEGSQLLIKRYTDNADAYQLYAKGVFLRNQMTEDALKKSVECFQKAIELDPDYALAYAGQASSISPLAYLGFITVKEAESRNRPLVAKALELDNMLAEAHAAMGELKLFIEWDWDGAERAFKRALELNPNEQLTHLLYPDLLLIKGQAEQAIAMSKSAYDMDPLSPRTAKALAHIYFYAGKYDQALEQSKKSLELFPNYHLIYLGPIYEQKGMYDQAIDGYLQTEERWGMHAENISTLRKAYATSGWRGYWRKRLELMKEFAKHAQVPAIYLAELYMRVGDKNRAFEWLEKARGDHDMSLIFLKVDPTWESLRSDPRFTNLLRGIGLTS